ALRVREQMARSLRAAVAARDVVDDVVRGKLDELVGLPDGHALARLDGADEPMAGFAAAVDASDPIPRHRDAPAGATERLVRCDRAAGEERRDDSRHDDAATMARQEAGHGRTSGPRAGRRPTPAAANLASSSAPSSAVPRRAASGEPLIGRTGAARDDAAPP